MAENSGKGILIVCDGLGDLREKGKTPLQAAKTPNMDRLAEHGACGLMHTIGRGIIPGSDTAHLQLFGYSTEKYYTGRGTFEALGVGIELEEGDVAFRCNFATVDEKMKILDRRAGRISTSFAKKLEQDFQNIEIDGAKVIFKASVEHRGALVLRGKGLSHKVGDTDPHSLTRLLVSKPLEGTPEAKKTAKILNEFTKLSHEKLNSNPLNEGRELPANILLSRGPGIFSKAPPMEEKFGIRSACVAGGALYKGVAKFVGMDILKVKGATGAKDTDLNSKADAVVSALNEYDFVFLHIKATDSFSHDGDFGGKKKFIEKIDSEVLPKLMETGANIMITGDHTTPCRIGDHSSHPTPFLMNGELVRHDDIKKFDEFSCANGSLGHLFGKDVMNMMVSLMGKAHIYGA